MAKILLLGHKDAYSIKVAFAMAEFIISSLPTIIEVVKEKENE